LKLNVEIDFGQLEFDERTILVPVQEVLNIHFETNDIKIQEITEPKNGIDGESLLLTLSHHAKYYRKQANGSSDPSSWLDREAGLILAMNNINSALKGESQ
jgi:hypothetical protein